MVFKIGLQGDALVGRMYLHGESGIVDDAVNCQSRIGRSDEATLRSGPNKKMIVLVLDFRKCCSLIVKGNESRSLRM